MRTFKNEEIVTNAKRLKSVTCNCCGKSFEVENSGSVQQFAPMFGYDSQYDSSGFWRFDMCEDCLVNLVKGFKVVPEGFMRDKSYIQTFELDHDLHQKLFEEWKKTGEWNCEDENPYKEYYEEEENNELQSFGELLGRPLKVVESK